MNEQVEVSVVIPAYLEEDNLRFILPRLQRVLLAIEGHSEVLVIDALCSKDNTQAVCEENNVRYQNRENTDNYGDAVRTGIKLARGKYIIFMDADGSHSPKYIPQLLAYRKEYDVVTASRYVSGGSTENSLFLIMMSRLLNLTYSLTLNLNCKDISNSFKLYRADVLKALALKCDNFDIIEEILFKLKRKNSELKIKEVPFCFEERRYGYTKRNLIVFMFSYIFTIIKLRRSK